MINIAFFSAKSYDEASFNKIKNNRDFEFHYHDFRLTEKTAKMAHGCDVVCAFVNDDLSAPVLKQLSLGGTKLIAMRCAGFDKVDQQAAKELGLQVVRVLCILSRSGRRAYRRFDDVFESSSPQSVSTHP